LIVKTSEAIRTIVIMGVSGSGKTSIGSSLAQRLGYKFIDADWLHPATNIKKMGSGLALNDADRLPWLHAVGRLLELESQVASGSVTACSALKRAYRDLLRGYVPDGYFVMLCISESLARARLLHRSDGFMPPTLLASQFATLEELGEDERGMRIDAGMAPDVIVDQILSELQG